MRPDRPPRSPSARGCRNGRMQIWKDGLRIHRFVNTNVGRRMEALASWIDGLELPRGAPADLGAQKASGGVSSAARRTTTSVVFDEQNVPAARRFD